MNPRQRRGVLLMVLAACGGLFVFISVISLINSVESKVGPEVDVYRLTQNVAAYTRMDDSMLETVKMPERWRSDTMITDKSDLVDKVAAAPLTKGSLLQADMVADQPALQPGQREIAILINAETGVAGKIRPGTLVDIFATFGEKEGQVPTSRIIVSRARVIEIGKLGRSEKDEKSDRGPAEIVPVTFALAPLDAQRVAYAESFAEKVRLAIVAPGTGQELSPGELVYGLERDRVSGAAAPRKGPRR